MILCGTVKKGRKWHSYANGNLPRSRCGLWLDRIRGAFSGGKGLCGTCRKIEMARVKRKIRAAEKELRDLQ